MTDPKKLSSTGERVERWLAERPYALVALGILGVTVVVLAALNRGQARLSGAGARPSAVDMNEELRPPGKSSGAQGSRSGQGSPKDRTLVARGSIPGAESDGPQGLGGTTERQLPVTDPRGWPNEEPELIPEPAEGEPGAGGTAGGADGNRRRLAKFTWSADSPAGGSGVAGASARELPASPGTRLGEGGASGRAEQRTKRAAYSPLVKRGAETTIFGSIMRLLGRESTAGQAGGTVESREGFRLSAGNASTLAGTPGGPAAGGGESGGRGGAGGAAAPGPWPQPAPAPGLGPGPPPPPPPPPPPSCKGDPYKTELPRSDCTWECKSGQTGKSWAQLCPVCGDGEVPHEPFPPGCGYECDGRWRLKCKAGSAGAMLAVADSPGIVKGYTRHAQGEFREVWSHALVPFGDKAGKIEIAIGVVDDSRMPKLVVAAAQRFSRSEVKVFSLDGKNTDAEKNFLAYGGRFGGGVRVATGDIGRGWSAASAKAGVAEIITCAGRGGGSHVRVWNGDGSWFQAKPGSAAGAPKQVSFFAYPGYTGCYVAAGDVRDGGLAEIVTGPGPTIPPIVKIWSIDPQGVQRLAVQFQAYPSTFTTGVRVAVADLNGDGRAEILTIPGPGGRGWVRAWTGAGAPYPSRAGQYSVVVDQPGARGGAALAAVPGLDEAGYRARRSVVFIAVGVKETARQGVHLRAFRANGGNWALPKERFDADFDGDGVSLAVYLRPFLP